MNFDNLDCPLPENGKSIDAWERDSKYIVKVFATSDLMQSFYEYSKCFYFAAHTTAKFLLTDAVHPVALDRYIFPLAFLYRHSIELIMKSIVFQYVHSDAERTAFIKDTFHDLSAILKVVENISQNRRPCNELNWIRSYFANISQVDKESDSFRYPFHLHKEKDNLVSLFRIKSVFNTQTPIDLVKFANKFEAAYEILTNWHLKNKSSSVEWLELQPSFIETGGFYGSQAVVGYDYSREKFHPYTSAYLDTANFFKHHMKEQFDLGKHSEVCQLFLPMCYLYRNSAELNLKALWFEDSNEDFHVRCEKMINKKHSVLGLWNLIKSHELEYTELEDGDNEFIKILDNYCRQLHVLDSDASRFRYPVQKNMQPYFNNNRRFDFMTVATFMEALNNALDCIGSEWDYRKSLSY